jgi:hypothetical protein
MSQTNMVHDRSKGQQNVNAAVALEVRSYPDGCMPAKPDPKAQVARTHAQSTVVLRPVRARRESFR